MVFAYGAITLFSPTIQISSETPCAALDLRIRATRTDQGDGSASPNHINLSDITARSTFQRPGGCRGHEDLGVYPLVRGQCLEGI